MKIDPICVIQSRFTWLSQTETWLFNQVRYLSPQVVSHIVCNRAENLDQFSLPNIHSLYDSNRLAYFVELGLRKLVMPQRRKYLSTMIAKSKAQLVHSHFGDWAWRDVKAVRKAGVKHVVTFYGYDVNMLPSLDRKWLFRYQELFDQSDLFLCEGPHMAKQIIALGCPQEKVKVHHLGVEIDTIPFKPRRWDRSEPLRVLIAATFREKKGIPYALEALAALQSVASLEVTIIGDATPEMRSYLEKQKIQETIRKHALSSNIHMLGYQPAQRLFAEAYQHHVFLSPSVTASDGDTEGGAPVSIIEMMASGMPVVSTSHCDIPEVLQYGIDDWLVEERNVNGLVERLKWLIEHPGEWDQLTLAGRKHVEAGFDARQQAARLEHHYRSVLFHEPKN